MSTVSSKFASSLQHVSTIATGGVQNTHHGSERTETVTENRVDQAGSCHHCGSHLSLALLIAPDQ